MSRTDRRAAEVVASGVLAQIERAYKALTAAHGATGDYHLAEDLESLRKKLAPLLAKARELDRQARQFDVFGG